MLLLIEAAMQATSPMTAMPHASESRGNPFFKKIKKKSISIAAAAYGNTRCGLVITG